MADNIEIDIVSAASTDIDLNVIAPTPSSVNIEYSYPVGPAGPAGINTWGSITGTLSTQTDLWRNLSAKAETTVVNSLTSQLLLASIYQNASGNWQNVYTNVNANSANWNSAYITTVTYQNVSSTFATKTFTDSKYLPLSGGIVTGNITTTGSLSTGHSLFVTNSASFADGAAGFDNSGNLFAANFPQNIPASISFSPFVTGSAIGSIQPLSGDNIVLGVYSSILGGTNNTINSNACSSTIAGGTNNCIIPAGPVYSDTYGYNTIGGGLANSILSAGLYTTIGGGAGNTSSGYYDVIGGGGYNNISTTQGYNTIAGGQNIQILSGYNAFAGGGGYNSVSGNYAAIVGGLNNVVSGDYSNVVGGRCNSASNTYSSIVGGEANCASGYASFTGGGYANCSQAAGAVVVGGYNNTASGVYSTVAGGQCNNAFGAYSSILGGCNNSDASYCNVFILGSNIGAVANDTTYVNNLCVTNNNYCAACATNSGYAYSAGTAGCATCSGYAGAAGYAYSAGTAGCATCSGYAGTAGCATCSGYAGTAGCATCSGYAGTAGCATCSGYAGTAGCATNSGSAGTAECATNSGYASSAGSAGSASTDGSGNCIYWFITGTNNCAVCYACALIGGGSSSTISPYVTGSSIGSIQPLSGNNVASGCYSVVAGGCSNTASGNYSNVAGGCNNNASGSISTVAGGQFNSTQGFASIIGGGFGNTASGYYTAILAGQQNSIAYTNYSTIINGCCNCVTGNYSSILGGQNNYDSGNSNVFILGSNICASVSNYTYVNNLSSQGTLASNTAAFAPTLAGPQGSVWIDSGGNINNLAYYSSTNGLYPAGSNPLIDSFGNYYGDCVNFNGGVLGGINASYSDTCISGNLHICCLNIDQTPSTFTNPVTAAGSFLIININGVNKAVQLWDYTS